MIDKKERMIIDILGTVVDIPRTKNWHVDDFVLIS